MSESAAEAPQPEAVTGDGAPQTGQNLAAQARAGLASAQAAHADAAQFVDWVREHAAGLIAGAEKAVQIAAQAVADAEALLENGGRA